MKYGEDAHNKHWAGTREIPRQIPPGNKICRRTGNNGQITQNTENNEFIGSWEMGERGRETVEGNETGNN